MMLYHNDRNELNNYLGEYITYIMRNFVLKIYIERGTSFNDMFDNKLYMD